jgi:hypothetical protein
MLALIALSIMRPPFIATIEDDPTDRASVALRLGLGDPTERGALANVVRPRPDPGREPFSGLDAEAIDPGLAAQ